jgi:hypothetical protein
MTSAVVFDIEDLSALRRAKREPVPSERIFTAELDWARIVGLATHLLSSTRDNRG